MRPALLLIDMQVECAGPLGRVLRCHCNAALAHTHARLSCSLPSRRYVACLQEHFRDGMAERLVRRLNSLAAACRAAGVPVIFTQVSVLCLAAWRVWRHCLALPATWHLRTTDP